MVQGYFPDTRCLVEVMGGAMVRQGEGRYLVQMTLERMCRKLSVLVDEPA